jgi:hypothetical protein
MNSIIEAQQELENTYPDFIKLNNLKITLGVQVIKNENPVLKKLRISENKKNIKDIEIIRCDRFINTLK